MTPMLMSSLSRVTVLNRKKRVQVLELEEEAGEDVDDDDGAVAAAWGRGREGSASTEGTDAAGPDAEAAVATSINSAYLLQVKQVLTVKTRFSYAVYLNLMRNVDDLYTTNPVLLQHDFGTRFYR